MISPELALGIWEEMQREGKAGRSRLREAPSAFQIRLGAYKVSFVPSTQLPSLADLLLFSSQGMLVVDHRLTGIQLRSRESYRTSLR